MPKQKTVTLAEAMDRIDNKLQKGDPHQRLCWRFSRRRLTFEFEVVTGSCFSRQVDLEDLGHELKVLRTWEHIDKDVLNGQKSIREAFERRRASHA